ncbi:BTB/POZ and TAZ domain-containing protein 2-like isoform X1 [Zingiber officinale]|uniref:BTB/POZ and TAZ domain-containing protein 2-like isoform X1 n=1 Tax=Zingiber officinale TaxID=94328 RepID=UPI001C4BD91A|nr:BTB/POZ and TAZ domain-containing protein 2-like isoform X1 [Zingiber officinale]
MGASSVEQYGVGGFRPQAAESRFLPPADVKIVTSDGRSIPAHSSVLASASPVLERMLDRSRKGGDGAGRVIHILGAPHDAVLVFVQCLYSSRRRGESWRREAAEEVARQGVALLALAHAYRVRWLKQQIEAAVAARWVSAATAVDGLKLARLCDAPRLFQRCLAVATKDFATLQQTEGWRFLQKHDPAMELEILQFVHESARRRKRWRRERTHQEMYMQLAEAMDSLQHICTEGCTDVGPRCSAPASNPCTSFSTCEGLQLLLRHAAACGDRKVTPKGCNHCKRLWQLFRLHSSLCEDSVSCRLPLCRQFKKKMEEEKEDKTWRRLVEKVATARVMATLANRKVPQLVQKSWVRYRGRR